MEPDEEAAPGPTDSPDSPWRVRKFDPAQDIDFVVVSWRRNYECADITRCPGGNEEYRRTQTAVILAAIAQGSSNTLVAYPVERPEQILGWACGRPSVLHYVYVKPYYRRHGIGWALAAAVAAVDPNLFYPNAVHLTHSPRGPRERRQGATAMVAKARRLGLRMEYNPALIFGKAP